MKIIIIGSGIAGIASAVRLSAAGNQVTIYETNDYPGGKLTAFKQGGFRFDAGPSLFTLPQLVDELFILCGEDPRQYFTYQKLEHSCKYFWEDGTRFHAPANAKAFAREASRVFSDSKSSILRYTDKSRFLYELNAPIFIQRSLHKLSNYLTPEVWKAAKNVHRFSLLSTMHETTSNYLSDPKLIQLFDRYATYNGSSPYKAPGVMTMIPHLETGIGTFFMNGGMHEITLQLKKLAERRGARFQFNKPVSKVNVSGGKATGITLKNGEEINADRVVCNQDIVPAYRTLLKGHKAPEKTLNAERSSSALIFYWGINRTFPELDLHNIFFSDDYREEFEALFDRKTAQEDPTIYINVTSKYESSDAPPGKENWFVMINVPADHGQDWEQLIPEIKSKTIEKLNRILGVDISEHIENESYSDPRKIQRQTSSYRGALYGAASNNPMAAFLRHPNFTRKIKGLYFCGGSVHPGGGIPLCLYSAKIVEDLIQ